METSGGVEGDESSSFPPYWALLGLSGAGFLETAYLTAVSTPKMIAPIVMRITFVCVSWFSVSLSST